MSLEAEGLVEVVQTTRLLNYFCVSGVVMLIADYIHTLPEEVRLIWPTARSIPKFLFLVVRYGNFVFCIVTSIYTLSPLPTLKECKGLSLTLLGLEVFLTSVGEGIMYFRVWAFSGADRQILYLLSSVYLVIVTAAWALMIKWFAQGTDVPMASLPMIPGLSCVPLDRNSLRLSAALLHGALVASLTFLAVLTVVIGMRRYKSGRRTRGGLLSEFYRGGFWYFAMLLPINILNILLFALQKHAFAYNFDKLQVAVHGVIVTRVILQLRKYSEKNQAHAMETASGSGQNESVMVGFVVTDHSDQSIPPMQFASHTERAVRPIQAPPAT